MNNKSNNKENFQSGTTSSAPLFEDVGYWNDNSDRTISPNYYIIINSNGNYNIYSSNNTYTILVTISIQYSNVEIRVDNNLQATLPIISNSITRTALTDKLNQWNTWAAKFAQSYNFDTWGYQAGNVLFFGKYGSTFTDTSGVFHTYKYDALNKYTGDTSNILLGTGWVNHVYILSTNPTSTLRTSTATTTTVAATTTAGQTTAGQTTAGQTTTARGTTAGQTTTARGTTAGQTTAGQTTAGQTTTARGTTAGQTTARGTTAGQTTARGTIAGQMTARGTTTGQTSVAPVVQPQTEQPTKLQTASAIVTTSSSPQDVPFLISKSYILIGIIILLIIIIFIIKNVILY
jgi:hypothetical protein